MKKVFDILQLWFLSSCVASFFTIIGSVSFVFGLLQISGDSDLRFFPGFEALQVGAVIASAAAFLICTVLLLPWMLFKGLATDEVDLGFTPWLTTLPGIIFLVSVFCSLETIWNLMALAAILFGFAGGWIFAKTYKCLYYKMMDAKNAGFFEPGSKIECSQNPLNV